MRTLSSEYLAFLFAHLLADPMFVNDKKLVVKPMPRFQSEARPRLEFGTQPQVKMSDATK